MTKVLRIAKIGKDALTATLPNDFIFNTDYNTPKIIAEGTDSPTLAVSATEVFRNVAHGRNYTPFVIAFCKYANGRVGPVGGRASNANFGFTNLRVNATNIRFGYFNDTGGNYSPTFKYYITEIPLAGTPNIPQTSGSKLAIAKPGFNALTETNPNNLIYDSRWGTFKYFVEGTKTINVPSGSPGAGVSLIHEEVVYTHNLGYYPFFTGQAEFNSLGSLYPFSVGFADGGVWGFDDLYMTNSQLIYRSDVGSVFGGSVGGYTIKIYYKIYSTNLGL